MAQKILIADDSAFMRFYLKRILAEAVFKTKDSRRSKHEVRCVGSGEIN